MTHKEYLQQIGMEIKVARIRKGLTTKDVIKLTGLSKAGYSMIERGKLDTRILSYKRIADALGVDMKQFV